MWVTVIGVPIAQSAPNVEQGVEQGAGTNEISKLASKESGAIVRLEGKRLADAITQG